MTDTPQPAGACICKFVGGPTEGVVIVNPDCPYDHGMKPAGASGEKWRYEPVSGKFISGSPPYFIDGPYALADYLNTQAAKLREAEAARSELSEILAQRYEDYGKEAARAEQYKAALESIKTRAARVVERTKGKDWFSQNAYAVADSALAAHNARKEAGECSHPGQEGATMCQICGEEITRPAGASGEWRFDMLSGDYTDPRGNIVPGYSENVLAALNTLEEKAVHLDEYKADAYKLADELLKTKIALGEYTNRLRAAEADTERLAAELQAAREAARAPGAHTFVTPVRGAGKEEAGDAGSR